MRIFLMLVGLIAGVLGMISPAVKSQSDQKKQAAPERRNQGKESGERWTPERRADEQNIRANVEAFEKAYNSKDAKAIANLFAPDGQIEDKDGDLSEGR